MAKRPGLYANIAAKKKRIAAGSGEKMRKKGAKGAPDKGAFKKILADEKKKKKAKVAKLRLTSLAGLPKVKPATAKRSPSSTLWMATR